MEIKVFIYLSKKLSVPFTRELRCVAWNYNRGFICAGGVDGSARLFKLHPESEKNLNNPFYMNSALEGHAQSASVEIAQWNEYYQKLTTSDDTGMIIVWAPNHQDNTWYEEMMNNRNKSTVVDMKWSHDGNKVAIAYEDGQVIVGSVEGNRIWAKDASANLNAVAFSGDSQLLLVGLADGEVHAYDSNGNFALKIPMAAIENVELEAALAGSKDSRKDMIVSMEYYVPPLKARDPEPRGGVDAFNPGGDNFLPRVIKQDTFEKNHIARSRQQSSRPRFVVAYQSGVIQLMKNEMDTQPIVIRERNTMIKQCRWSPDGSILAVGAVVGGQSGPTNVLFLMSPWGEKYQALTLPSNNFNCFTWKGDGLMIGCGIDNNLYLATLKPRYKWAYCNQSIVYCYEQADAPEDVAVFYETKMREKHEKHILNIVNVEAFQDLCVLASHTSEIGGPYLLQLCNSIGTPVAQQSITIEPKYISINDGTVVAANNDSFVVWNYIAKAPTNPDVSKSESKQEQENNVCKVYQVDQPQANGRPVTSHTRTGYGGYKQTDNIRSVCVGKNFVVLSRESGALYRYSLPNVSLQSRTPLGYTAEKMLLNCTSTRLAIISTTNTFKLFDIKESGSQVVANFERKDVWDMKWDSDKEDTIAIMEKSRLHVIQGTIAEDPVANHGYICSFKDLIVRTVEMQTLMQDPKDFDMNLVSDIEVKTLRKAKELLDAGKISDATVFIEQNSHPKLWNLLAKVAMMKLDFKTAEHAFVKLKDYGGICFVKKLETIQSDNLRKAEVLTFYGDLDGAQEIYLQADRRDLAIDMRKKMNDWREVLRLLNFRLDKLGSTTASVVTDALTLEALKHAGDWFAERQKWAQAARYYEAGRHYEELVSCYIKLDDFGRMENLANDLPDGHDMLKRLAEHFGAGGLCELAVDCYIRCDMLDVALDTCIKLNQWDMAVDLSKKYHLRDVESLLGKYAAELTGSNEKTLAAVQLFRKAGKYLQAARKVFEIAREESHNATARRLKKLYVLGALLVEMYRDQNKALISKTKEQNGNTASLALQGLLEEDKSLSITDTRLMDNAWRGAEAWHFFMLAHRQLYAKQYDAALKTCLVVSEYEEYVDVYEINCMLALVSAHAGQYAICSKAFMKLDTLSSVTDTEKDQFNKLAMEIFLKYPPRDTRDQKIECTTCEAIIPDCSIVCPNPNCNTRFPICIATGRPLLDYQFWLCPSCKHRAYEQEIQSYKYCPLCHYEI